MQQIKLAYEKEKASLKDQITQLEREKADLTAALQGESSLTYTYSHITSRVELSLV